MKVGNSVQPNNLKELLDIDCLVTSNQLQNISKMTSYKISQAKNKLGWEPEYSLEDLVNDMMDSDVELMKKEHHIKEGEELTLKYTFYDV